MNKSYFSITLFFLCCQTLKAQMSEGFLPPFPSDSTKVTQDSLTSERDLTDVFHWLSNKWKRQRLDKPKKEAKRVQLAFIPAVGYSLQTGAAALMAANLVFFTNKNDSSRTSTVQTSLAYTQKEQTIAPLAANIWSKNGKYNFISDVRYMNYPSSTFGLGAYSQTTDEYTVDYNYLRVHQSVLRQVVPNLFAGIGFYYDAFWRIKELDLPENTVTSFQEYGLTTAEKSAGFNFQAVFDNRKNPVNATQGWYASARFRTNKTALGSDANWDQTIIEVRKYTQFPQNSRNVLALWNFNWFTTAGNPPYLMLPSTGWDDFFNTGRGYIQGRYRAPNMSYLEAEYRFPLTRNGILGGVVFGNMQTFSQTIARAYQTVALGYGAGLRLKLNKQSGTNLCIDYGWGANGSGGVFINLGETF